MKPVQRIKDGRLETRTNAGTWVHSWHGPKGTVSPKVILARKQEHDRLAAVGFDDAFIREEIARQERYGVLAPAEAV